MKRVLGTLTVFIYMAIAAGCATVGQSFNVDAVPRVEIGKTSMEDVRRLFGNPWRTGIEDGRTTWTYGRYKYKLFGSAKTQDLVLRFDAQNVVASYTFNTTEHDEKGK
jgi:hypothetical protein